MGHARSPRRPPEGRHRDAPRGMPRRGRRRTGRADRRPARAQARGGVHAPRHHRRARQPLHGRAAGPLGAVLDGFVARGLATGTVHTCNTAGAIVCPAGRFDMVRVGIGCYGIAPADELEGSRRPPAGDGGEGARGAREGRAGGCQRVSYGLRYDPHHDTRIATVPIGYADGVQPRAAAARRCRDRRGRRHDGRNRHDGPADARRRRPRRGSGRRGRADRPAGRRGDHRPRRGRGRWAPIAYTVVCGIEPHIPRVYVS